MNRSLRVLPIAAALAAAACGGRPATPPVAPEPVTARPAPAQADRTEVSGTPVLPPHVALLAGLMPLRSTGVDSFRVVQPLADGRGVVIAILDSGIDPGLPGLSKTTTGEEKLLDLRDFSGEGRIPLARVAPDGAGRVTIGRHVVGGLGRVMRLAGPPVYGGVFREQPLGGWPEADVDGNGSIGDEHPMVVAKSSAGWFVIADTNGDGSLDDETPIRDFSVAREVLAFGRRPLNIAVNLDERDGAPVLDLVFDNSGHGSHVAGIAAGHNLFGIDGFDGVAPGAQLLGLKISNNARGGISVTGSMLRAMNYAADFARRRRVPMVVNLSFGVGNEFESTAAIDSMVNEFALKHPDIPFVISAGNDGPGVSTMGFPASAEHALTVCALYPGVFARAPVPGVPPAPDAIGWWSARGGELAKPDVCAPGIAFSNVPPWRTGEEISGGTSMAAPHVAGIAALLLSGLTQQGRQVRAVDLKRALLATATRIEGGSVLDQGAGVPNAVRAYQWLQAAHQTGLYQVTAVGPDRGRTAAYRRDGLKHPGDTIQEFEVRSVGGQPAARWTLKSDAPWLRAPAMVEPQSGAATITVTYDAAQLTAAGIYVGTVWARSASDTASGPQFALTNTVIVPHQLEAPLVVRGEAPAGGIAREFVAVPRGAAGLVLELTVPQGKAMLHLFEPSGQPYRGGSEAVAADTQVARIVVAAEDLKEGVYEAVVAAPPDDKASYTLRAMLPGVAVAEIAPDGRARVVNVRSGSRRAIVRAELVGAVRAYQVSGQEDHPQVLHVRVPPWAARMVVDVELPRGFWQTLTDFGVTVFDDRGFKVDDGPLHYAFGRIEVELDADSAPPALSIELLPAYAHLRPPPRWEAWARVAFERRERIPVPLAGSGQDGLMLGPDETRVVTPLLARLEPWSDFSPLLEVAATDEHGVVARRRGAVTLTPPPAEGQR